MRTIVRFLVGYGVLLLLAGSDRRASAQGERGEPHYQIFVVDVSASMVTPFFPPHLQHLEKTNPPDKPGRGAVAPSDPEGIRWDGVQFAIDISPPTDRVALVLFSANAVVVTEQIPGSESGFIELGKVYKLASGETLKGHALLRALITELQTVEARFVDSNKQKDPVRDYNKFDFMRAFESKVLPGFHVQFTSGTSSVMTLDSIQQQSALLKALPHNRCWTFLFTDGQEEFDPIEIRKRAGLKGTGYHAPPDRYDTYLAALKQARATGDRGRLGALAAGWVKGFAGKETPIITFAIGDHCDDDLLDELANQSNPSGNRTGGRSGAFYKVHSNLEMLDQLQDVVWEIRKYWRAWPSLTKDARQDVFPVPELHPWDDLGLLLYQRTIAGRDGKSFRAKAPLAEDVGPLRLGTATVPPVQARAYWYYSLSPAWARAQNAPLDQAIVLRVRRPAPDVAVDNRAVLALRPKEPLFTIRSPANQASYTPLDAIPFQVGFTPPRLVDPERIRAEHFEVTATLTPVSGATKARPAIKLSLGRQQPDANGVVSFHCVHVLDADPATKGNPDLLGGYHVDIVIGCHEGLLKGATRKLLRRTIIVERYPRITGLPSEVVLANDDAIRADQTLPFTLHLKAPPADRTATMVVERPTHPLVQASTQPFTLANGKGQLRVLVAGPDWSKLPLGKTDAGFLRISEPWHSGAAPQLVRVTVDRKRLKLEAPRQVSLDLAGKNSSARQSISVALRGAPAGAAEEVWLSTTNDPTRREMTPTTLTLSADNPGAKPLKVTVTGFGVKTLARAANQAPAGALAFTLSRSDTAAIPDGVFRQTVYLVGGPGIESQELRVEVNRRRITLAAPAPLVIALHGTAPSAEIRVTPSLAGDHADEEVALSATDGAPPNPAGTILALTGANGAKISVAVDGLGKRTLARSPGKSPVHPLVLRFRLVERSDDVQGKFTGKLHLVGPGVHSKALDLTATCNLLTIRVPESLPFTLRGQGVSASANVGVSLLANPEAAEQVWLSTDPAALQPRREMALKLKSKGGKVVDVQVIGLGMPVQVTTQKESLATLPVTLKRAAKDRLEDGEIYRADVHVVGLGIQARPVTLLLTRARFLLTAPQQITFDLSGDAPAVTQRIDVALRAMEEAAEKIYLCADAAGTVPADGKLVFRRTTAPPRGEKPTPGKSRLHIQELGKQWDLKSTRAGGAATSVQLTLLKPKDLAPGRYAAQIWLKGEGIQAYPVTVHAEVEQIYLAVRDGDDFRELRDGRLSCFALANNPITHTVVLRSRLATDGRLKPQAVHVKDQPEVVRQAERGIDRLPLRLQRTTDAEFHLAVTVPASVQEGKYEVPLSFEVRREERPGLAAQLVLQVQVAHLPIRPKLFGPLRLVVDPKQGADIAGRLELVSDAPEATPVRWSVKCDDLPLPANDGVVRRLGSEHIEFQVVKGQPLNGPGDPRSSISREHGCELSVIAHCDGLAPGLYRTRLRLDGTVDAPKQIGKECYVDLEVLVPGRTVQARLVPGQRPEEGGKVNLAVQVDCFGPDCKPGTGWLVPLDGPARTRVEIKLDHVVPQTIKQADLSMYRTEVAAPVSRAGVNAFEVQWPRHTLLPDKAYDSVKVSVPGAIGLIHRPENVLDAKGTVLSRGEKATFFVNADALPGARHPVRLAVVRGPTHGGKPPVPVNHEEVRYLELFDDGNQAEHGDAVKGDNKYSGVFTFAEPGWYTVYYPQAPGETLQLKPTEVLVGFEREPDMADPVLSDMYYGGGGLTRFVLSPSPIKIEQREIENLVRLTNRHDTPCRFTATLWFPLREEHARQIKNVRDFRIPRTDHPDETMHLEAQLFAAPVGGTVDDSEPHRLTGTLAPDETLQLGVRTSLSKDAIDNYYRGTGKHKTLGYPNGMFVQLQLEWTASNGITLTRTEFVPFEIETQHAGWWGLLATLIWLLVISAFCYGTYRLAKWCGLSITLPQWRPAVNVSPPTAAGEVLRAQRDEEPQPNDKNVLMPPDYD